jgi:hypothetical protein
MEKERNDSALKRRVAISDLDIETARALETGTTEFRSMLKSRGQ